MNHKHTRECDCNLDVLSLLNQLNLFTNLWEALMSALNKESKSLRDLKERLIIMKGIFFWPNSTCMSS